MTCGAHGSPPSSACCSRYRTSCGCCCGASRSSSPSSPTGFATVIRGTSPQGLHNFLAAYLRYQTHVYAFLQLVANPFPGFTGRAGSYPVDVEIEGPERQNRWVTGFRLFMAIPALIMSSALAAAALLAALYMWFHGLFRAQVPRGLRNLGAYQLRYQAQTYGYLYLLTEQVSVQRSRRRLAADAHPHPAAARDLTTAPQVDPAGGRDRGGLDRGRCAAVADPGAGRPTTAGPRPARVLQRPRPRAGARLRALHPHQRGPLDDRAGRGARPVRAARRALHARVRGRADRDGNAARHAGLRVRVDGRAAVRPRPAVVGPPPRRVESGLPRVGREQLLRPRRRPSCSYAWRS